MQTKTKDYPDTAIDWLRKILATDGWIIDPTTLGGDPYSHQIGVESANCNIMASYTRPHGASVCWEAEKYYGLKASLCEGAGYGGKLIARIAVNQHRPFGKHVSPQQWAEEAYSALTKLKQGMT